jgi:hypothetical protein
MSNKETIKLVLLHSSINKDKLFINSLQKKNLITYNISKYSKINELDDYINNYNISHLAFIYHYPGYLSVPFFDKIYEDHVVEDNEIEPLIEDINNEPMIEDDTYFHMNNNIIQLIKNINNPNLIVDLLSCNLNDNNFTNEIKQIQNDLGINIRYSLDQTGNNPNGNWILESDDVNIKDLYFTEQINNWNGVLNSGRTPQDIITNLSNYFSWDEGTKTLTLLQDIEWEIIMNEAGWDYNDYIQLGANEIFDGSNNTITFNKTIAYQGLFSTNGTSINDRSIINNLSITKVFIDSYCGGIIRQQQRFFKINNCNTKDVYCTTYSGCIVGQKCGNTYGKIEINNCYNISDAIFGSGIAGYYIANMGGTCIINNCFNTSDLLSGGGIVGDKCGYNNGTCIINNCYNTGDISTGSGGIANTDFGYNCSLCIINNCYNTGNISRTSGGITGYTCGIFTSNGTYNKVIIQNCFNLGTILDEYSSGIVGWRSGSSIKTTNIFKIINCYNTSNLDYNNCGGILGSYSSCGEIINCYSSGIISNSVTNTGGIVAGNNGGLIPQVFVSVTNCYSNTHSGNLQGGNSSNKIPIDGNYVLDDLLNLNDTSILNISLNIGNDDVSGNQYILSDNPDINYPKLKSFTENIWVNDLYNTYNDYPLIRENIDISYTVLELYIKKYSINDILQYGYDIDSIITNNNFDIQTYIDHNGYSINELFNQNIRLCNILESNFLFKDIFDSSYNDAIDFIDYSNNVYTLTKDIIFTEYDFKNICFNLNANEIFDGDNHIIDLQKESIDGLFTTNGTDLSNATIIKNIGVINGYINQDGASIIRKEQSYFIIENCYNSCDIGYETSGIIGNNAGSFIMKNCYNTGNMYNTYSSGLAKNIGIGNSTYKISNCYNTGNIYDRYSSGIVNISGSSTVPNSMNSHIIENCYNTGNIYESYSAGIVYYTYYTKIINCYNSGTINGTRSGGIVSRALYCNVIRNCYNLGTINSIQNGGIGYFMRATSSLDDINNNQVQNCYNSGSINGRNSGGIFYEVVGNHTTSSLLLYQCYNTGNMNDTYSGGIVSVAEGVSILGCYNTGDIYSNCGGIIRYNNTDNIVYILGCYSSGNLLDERNSGGITASGTKSTITKRCYSKRGSDTSNSVYSNFGNDQINGDGYKLIHGSYNIDDLLNVDPDIFYTESFNLNRKHTITHHLSSTNSINKTYSLLFVLSENPDINYPRLKSFLKIPWNPSSYKTYDDSPILLPYIEPYMSLQLTDLSENSYDIENITNIDITTNGEILTNDLLKTWKIGKELKNIRKVRHALLNIIFENNNITNFITTTENLGISYKSEKQNMKVLKSGESISINDDFSIDTGIYGNLSAIDDNITITLDSSSSTITKISDTVYQITGDMTGTYNEGDKVSLFGYDFYLGGVSSDGVMTGYALGDPHIKPIKGDVYELPNKVTNYRLVQGNGIIINGSTRKLLKEEGKLIENYYENKYGEKAPENLITNGVFYNEIFIKSKEYEFKFNFDKKSGVINGDKNKIKLVSKQGGIIVNLLDKEISISLCYYSNPQIKYGINCNVRNVKGLSGLLIKECLTESMELQKITDIGLKKGINKKNKKISYLKN